MNHKYNKSPRSESRNFESRNPQSRGPDPERRNKSKTNGQGHSITTVKIQKVLANHGLASRRTIEQWLTEGRITVNHKTAMLGDRMSLHDTIAVEGRVVNLAPLMEEPQIIIYHKPVGQVCSRYDEGELGTLPSVFRALPKPASGRWVMVGRLDVNTSGLLLFTNSGDLAHRMMHPSFKLEREYLVRVLGELTPEVILQLKKGVMLEDGPARFDKFISLRKGEGAANQWFQVVLQEGRNREVRRMFESQGLKVSRLVRIRFGQYRLPRNLPSGKWVEVEPVEQEERASM